MRLRVAHPDVFGYGPPLLITLTAGGVTGIAGRVTDPASMLLVLSSASAIIVALGQQTLP